MITALNKTFQPDNILTAAELNDITGKIDEIVMSLSSAGVVIGQGDNSEEFEALKSQVGELALEVKGKIGAESIAALKATIGTKTDNEDFQNLVNTVGGLTVTVNGKLGAEDLVAVNAEIAKKATISQLEAVDAKISGKANIEDLEAVKTVTDHLKVNKDGEIGITEMFTWSTENGSKGGLTVPSTGSTYPNDVEITNEIGIHVTNDSGSDVLIGNGNDGFGVYANGQKGFTGTINFAGTTSGIRFVNGICVGTTDN